MKLAVDVMGSDRGPETVVLGAVDAVKELGIDVVLVGDEDVINKTLADNGCGSSESIEVRHASEVITMEDHAMEAVRRKKDSSMICAIKMVKEGAVQAMITAGSTGALVAAGPIVAGRIRGMLRPALATPLPSMNPNEAVLMLDVGANPQCKAEHLVQFAGAGAAYYSAVFGLDKPRVALLSNGTERYKGNEAVVQAHSILESVEGINFIGNVEARECLDARAQVIVCDGFSGNIALKTIEGTAINIMKLVKDASVSNFRSKMGGLLLKPALGKVKKFMDYSEYGGAPLLGIDGLLIKAHGSSDRLGIKSAIKVAITAVEHDTVELIRKSVTEIKLPQQ